MSATDEFGKHEVVHTASIIVDMIAMYLQDHEAVETNPKWRALVQTALAAAMEVYQVISADTMMRRTLQTIIQARSFRKGEFILASGKPSKYFFDLKPTMLDPAGSNMIADLILDKIEEIGAPFAAVGGMATGGIPLVAVVCAKSNERAFPIKGIFVRKATKDHGTEQLIEGSLRPGERVILVEDVTTTGTSIIAAVEAVRAAGAAVSHVITVVDRLEGAQENLANIGITLHALFTRKDFDDE
jgi:orotate phosphoribosyltransferase